MRPGDARWPGRRPPRGWAEPAAATSAISWLGRVRLWQRLQFGELQVGGGLLFFSQVRGDFFFFSSLPSLLLSFKLSLSGWGVWCVQKSACNGAGFPRWGCSGLFSPLLLLLLPLSLCQLFLLCGRIQGASAPPPTFPSDPVSTWGRKKPRSFLSPGRRAAPRRLSPRPPCGGAAAAAARLRSPPAPPGAAPASGGRSRTWAPCGAPPPPRRRPRFPPGPGARSPPVLPPRFICCCCSPSLSLSPF